MSSTTPSPLPSAPTTSDTGTAKVTVQAAIVGIWTIEVPAGDEAEATRVALEHRLRVEWDDLALSLARAIRDVAEDEGATLNVVNIVAGQEQLLTHRGNDG